MTKQLRFVTLSESMAEAVTKTIDDKPRPAGDFLVVEDPEETSTWHLPVKVDGTPDRALAGAAWAALFSPGGYRGNKYEGPQKGEAQTKLRALYKAEDWDEPAAEAAPVKEMDYEQALVFFNAAVENLTALGQLLIGDEEPDAEPEPEAEPDAEPEEPMEASELSELAAPVVTLLEQDAITDRRAPLTMEVGIIKVGPGNKRDNHYYTREMLERDGKPAFEGLTMHVVDHNENQRSEQTDVSTIKEVVGVRDMKDGAYLVANVTAYDPDFCEKTRNRHAAGELGKLQCSILAKGSAVTGEIDGETYNVVQSITEGRFVDWVTRAGAGGKAIALAESEPEPEAEPEETEPTDDVQEVDIEETDETPPQISMSEALNALSETNLPAASLVQLAEGTYENIGELETAITAEIERLKAAGSGKPFATPKQQTPSRRRSSRAEITEAQNAVNSKWLD